MKVTKVDYEFETVIQRTALPKEFFVCVAPDSDGTLWAGVHPSDDCAAEEDMFDRLDDFCTRHGEADLSLVAQSGIMLKVVL